MKSIGIDLIFSPVTVAGLRLRNRIVMAPMTRRFANDNGDITPPIIEYYRRRAAGEVGLIISEGTAIDSLHAYDTPTAPRIEKPEHFSGWRKVVEAVHAEGGAFAPQLWHTGRMGADPIGPSEEELPPRKDGTARPVVKEMSEDDFRQVIDAFVNAAVGAKEIGCDAIELHGAHGYLLDSFVSPVNNRRTDAYGGNAKNRMRFPLAIVRAVRKSVGDSFPVIYRFSQWKVDDYNELKFKNPDELAVWVNALKDAGIDILHVSTRRAVDIAFPEHGKLTLAGWSRKLSGLPTIAVGSVSVNQSMDQSYNGEPSLVENPESAFKLVKDGEVDMIAVGRALIANPDWVKTVRDDSWRNLKPYSADLLSELK